MESSQLEKLMEWEKRGQDKQAFLDMSLSSASFTDEAFFFLVKSKMWDYSPQVQDYQYSQTITCLVTGILFCCVFHRAQQYALTEE
jgi:hypothetical protein